MYTNVIAVRMPGEHPEEGERRTECVSHLRHFNMGDI